MATDTNFQIYTLAINFIEKLGSAGLFLIAAGWIIWRLNKSTLTKYLETKGENLATKDDIGKITEIVEDIKTENQKAIVELQNTHQLKFAEIERSKALKKEVFLEAAGALIRSLNTITAMSNLSINTQTITSSNSLDAGILAKVQIVGTEKTVLATTTVTALVATSLLDLMLDRSVLDQRKDLIQSHIDARSKSIMELERYLAIMKEFNLQNNSNTHQWNALNTNVEYENRVITDNQNKIDELVKIQNAEHFTFVKKCLDSYFKLNNYVPELVLAIREELDMPISKTAYLAITNNNSEIGKKVMTDFFDEAYKRI